MTRADDWRIAEGAGLPDPGALDLPASSRLESLALAGFELSLDTGPLEALEAATRSLDLQLVQQWCAEVGTVHEAALLVTCHRVELLLVRSASAEGPGIPTLLPGSPQLWHPREGRALVEHLVEVARGQRSVARGEADIRAQVAEAARTTWSRYPRPLLRDLLRSVGEAAERPAAGPAPPPSIAGVAAEVVRARLPPGAGPVVVVGSGTVGRRAAELLADRGPVVLVHRRRAPDPEFLMRTGARAVPLEASASVLERAAAVVCAAAAEAPLLTQANLPATRPLLLVDLGVPRNIDPNVRGRPGVELLDLADLRRQNALEPADPTELERARDRADELWRAFEQRLLESWIDSFRRAAEELRRQELGRGRPFLGTLTPEQERAVELLTRRLVDRLLRAPTERLRALPAGPEGEAVRRAALLLFRSADPEP